MAMSDIDRQFVEDIVNSTEEEFDQMISLLTDEELYEVLALIREAKAEVIEQELEAMECNLTSLTEAGMILQRIKRGSN